jgi:lysylphosphatidylglycerol synthetase-like protein (DUF2156 family)
VEAELLVCLRGPRRAAAHSAPSARGQGHRTDRRLLLLGCGSCLLRSFVGQGRCRCRCWLASALALALALLLVELALLRLLLLPLLALLLGLAVEALLLLRRTHVRRSVGVDGVLVVGGVIGVLLLLLAVGFLGGLLLLPSIGDLLGLGLEPLLLLALLLLLGLLLLELFLRILRTSSSTQIESTTSRSVTTKEGEDARVTRGRMGARTGWGSFLGQRR